MATDLASRPLRQVTQTILYDPAKEKAGIFGNCLQAALASAMDMELEAVPNFAAFAWWDVAARLWLRGKGADWRILGDDWRAAGSPVPVARSIVVGPSPRHTGRHAVVGEGGTIAWDPHPDRTGLVEVQQCYLLEKWPTGGRSACVICGAS